MPPGGTRRRGEVLTSDSQRLERAKRLKCYSFTCGGTAGHPGRVRTTYGGGRCEERGAPAWSVAPLFSLLDLRFRTRRVLPAPPAARSHERYPAAATGSFTTSSSCSTPHLRGTCVSRRRRSRLCFGLISTT